MTFEEYRQHDGLALAERVRCGEVQPSELLDAAIARIEETNPQLNAVVHPLYERARAMAGEVDRQAPFAGVPFLLKDLSVEVAGTPFSQGCAALRRHVSGEDSELAVRYRRAGLLFTGKTNTSEFGLTPYTEPRGYGAARNPWDTRRTPGGSSGGSAAAVAAGMVPLASASDGGGSIRIPASCCGLFGIKPTRGRITFGPQQASAWQGATMAHCVSRSVRDSAALLDATAGPMPGDPYQVPAPERPYLDEVNRPPSTLRIGFATTHPLGQWVDPQCVAAVGHTATLLENLGHRVEEVELPLHADDLARSFITMIMGETAATVAELEQCLGRPATRHDVEPATWALAVLGRAISAERFVLAIRRWNDLARRMGLFHQKYDLLLTPVVAFPPFPIGQLQPGRGEERLIGLVNRFNLGRLALLNIDRLAEKVFSYIPFTPLANMTGQPSMSVPLYWTPDGLPTGSMFTADFGREDLLFRLAGQLEQAAPWFHKIPEPAIRLENA